MRLPSQALARYALLSIRINLFVGHSGHTPDAIGGMGIRVATLDGSPWFVGADVCRALGLASEDGGYSRHYRTLAQDERRVMSLAAFAPGFEIPGQRRGGLRPSNPISWIAESGLYRLVLRSDKPEARQFQDWVTRVVLPAIRRDGAYVQGEEGLNVWRTGIRFPSVAAPAAPHPQTKPRRVMCGYPVPSVLPRSGADWTRPPASPQPSVLPQRRSRQRAAVEPQCPADGPPVRRHESLLASRHGPWQPQGRPSSS
jgi:prophage antirepressor-like protein